MICFILPEYINEIGDCCRYKDSNREEVIRKRLNSIIKGICNEMCIDFRAVKNRSSKLLNQRNLTPLYINESDILIPIKIRTPRCSRDGGYGYINMYYINEIMDKYILLKSGEKIFFKDSKRTIIKRLKMAKLLKERVMKRELSIEWAYHNKEEVVNNDLKEILKQLDFIKTTMERISQL